MVYHTSIYPKDISLTIRALLDLKHDGVYPSATVLEVQVHCMFVMCLVLCDAL